THDEDFLTVHPQVDMAVLCYIRDDPADEFADRPKNSCRAQSNKTKGLKTKDRYIQWQRAIENTGAKIVASLGHENEVSVAKVNLKQFEIVLNPELSHTSLPPVSGKPPANMNRYGLAVRNGLTPLFIAPP
ncbi:MAG: hypothetical protein AAF204_05005, partial [Pseudomonadota bacterium]